MDLLTRPLTQSCSLPNVHVRFQLVNTFCFVFFVCLSFSFFGGPLLSLCLNEARGRTNLELREKFILPEGASQGMAAFRSRGRRSKPSSRTASPTRSSSSASQSAQSCASVPSAPATPTASSRVSFTSVHTVSHGPQTTVVFC